jgi:hypothetical protein
VTTSREDKIGALLDLLLYRGDWSAGRFRLVLDLIALLPLHVVCLTRSSLLAVQAVKLHRPVRSH